MEFRQIKYFLAVCDTLNFTRAAEQTHVSQPALTRAVQKLEDELGSALFNRLQSGTEITLFGKMMREHFSRIEEAQSMAREAAQYFLGQDGQELNIGIMCTIGPDLLSPFIEEFQKNNKDTLLIFHDHTPEVLTELVLSGALDCAIVGAHGSQKPNNLSAEPLFLEKMVVTFSRNHRFAGKNEITLYDLQKENYVDRLKCEFRKSFFKFMEKNKLDLNVVCSSQREDWIQELVLHGTGVSVMPRYSIMSQRLNWKPLTGPLSDPRTVYISWSEKRPMAKCAADFVSGAKSYSWITAMKKLDRVYACVEA